MKQNIKRTKSRGHLSKGEKLQAFLMVLIPLLGFVFFSVYPIIWTFRWSFYSYNGIPSQTSFIGLANFKRLFTTDFTYWKTWLTTLEFALMKMPVELPLAMLIAMILSRQKIRGGGFMRAVYYLPNIISTVVVGLIISCMFSYNGLINAWLVKAGFISEPIDWFSTKLRAMTMLTVGTVWATFGINVMYFMAALCNVPEEVYESAKLDGANKGQTFFKITLPMIMPVFSTILLMSLIGTLSTNEYVIAVTGGGPSGKTQTVMSYLTQAFVPGFSTDSNPPLGYGCSMALLTTILFGLIAVAYKKFDKKMQDLY